MTRRDKLALVLYTILASRTGIWRRQVRLPLRRSWKCIGYKELASALGPSEGDEEERQCLVLHLADVVGSDWDPGMVPSLVQQKAKEFRATLWNEAA